MSGPITFFKPRAATSAVAAEAETCEIEVPFGPGAMRLYVHSPQPLDPQRVESWRATAAAGPRSQEGLGNEILQQVWETLQRGGGGVVVSIQEVPGRPRRAGVWPASREGEAAFSSFGVLPAGFPLRFEEVGERPVELPPGAHLFVPVDREAEAHLRRFQEDLTWLSPDLESQVLHAIRRPSLDARLTQLESLLSAAPAGMGAVATPTAMSVPSRWAQWRGRLAQPWRRLGGGRTWLLLSGLLLAALLALQILLLYRLDERLNTLSGRSAAAPGSTAHGPARGGGREAARARDNAGGGGPTGAAAASGTASATTLVSEVIRAVHEQRGTSSALTSLDTSGFAPLANRSAREIAHLLADPAAARPLALAVMKLEALRFDYAGSSDAFYRGTNNLSEVKATLKRLLPSVTADANAPSLLAAFACLAFGSRTPSLPKTANVPALDFAPGASCSSFPLETAAPGLADLLTYLRGAGTTGAGSAP